MFLFLNNYLFNKIFHVDASVALLFSSPEYKDINYCDQAMPAVHSLQV